VARGMLYVKKPRRARSSPAHVAHVPFVKHNICRVAQLVAPIHTRSVAAGASTTKTHEGGISLVFLSVAAASSATNEARRRNGIGWIRALTSRTRAAAAIPVAAAA
jgi:hypothetical protein